MTLDIAFAATRNPWQQEWVRHVHSFAVDERVAAIVADPRDLFEQEWRVLLIDGSSAWLTEDFVAEVHGENRGVVAVCAPDDERRQSRADEMGVDLVVTTAVTMVDLSLHLHAVARAHPASARAARTRITRVQPRSGGQVIAVGGPPGSRPDRVAMALAVALTRAKQRVVVVDANDVDPRLAQVHDLHPDPNITTAATAPDDTIEAHLQPVARGRFPVLAGMADPLQWQSISVRGAVHVIGTLARSFDRVVVVVGPIVEDLPRFALTTAVLGRAEAVVPVGLATPDDLVQLITWVAGAARAATNAAFYPCAVHGSISRSQRNEVAELLCKVAALVPGPDVVALIPGTDDKEDRGRWDGRLAHRRGLSSGIERLAREVVA